MQRILLYPALPVESTLDVLDLVLDLERLILRRSPNATRWGAALAQLRQLYIQMSFSHPRSASSARTPDDQELYSYRELHPVQQVHLPLRSRTG